MGRKKVKKIKIPRVTKHYSSVEEFEEIARKYYDMRSKILNYIPYEMRAYLKITPEQLGLITNIYNKYKDLNKAMVAVREKASRSVTTPKKHEQVYAPPRKKIQRALILNYKDYLKSDYWKEHRRIILSKNHKCVLCNKKALHIHHRSYRFKGTDNEIDDLVGLCDQCHSDFHKTHSYDGNLHLFVTNYA